MSSCERGREYRLSLMLRHFKSVEGRQDELQTCAKGSLHEIPKVRLVLPTLLMVPLREECGSNGVAVRVHVCIP